MRYRGYGSPGLSIVVYIIITCLVIFVATSISPRLADALAFEPRSFMERPWTILTSIFVHAGITHVLFNMLTLYFFGTFFVDLVGSKWFLAVYLVGGIVGNILFWLLTSPSPPFFPSPAVVGASGAIFAIGGGLAVMRPKLPVFIFPIPAPIPLWVAVLGGFFLTYFGSGNIAWQAHLGGLAFGALAGLFFRSRERRTLF